uniref:3-phosphoinositide-dependent protein kinase 1 n=1 Tax=Anopheles dirus TaxID=7168 RepID=A0A182NA01_9DIPT
MENNRTRPSSGHRLNANDFYFGKMLGEGSFSCVYLAKEVRTSKKYAIKVCEKRLILREKKQDYVKREREVLNRLTGKPGFLGLYCTFQDRTKLYFVMTYACNGTLLSLLSRPSFTIDCARIYAAEILLALETMHNMGILHRDIKPENILLDERMHVLMADFGSSKLDYKQEDEQHDESDTREAPPSPTMSTARQHAQRVLSTEYRDEDDDTDDTDDIQPAARTNKRRSFVGTAQYVSPEILTGTPSSPASDLWSYGCTIYQMVCGVSPFRAASEYLIFKMILHCQVTYADSFDMQARDLVARLLQIEQRMRLGARDNPRYTTIREHPFFSGIDFEHLRSMPAPLPPATESVLNSVYFPEGMQPGLDDRQITRLFDFKLAELNENEDVRDDDEDEKGGGGRSAAVSVGCGSNEGAGEREDGGGTGDKDDAESNRGGTGRVFSLTRSGFPSLRLFKSVEDVIKNDPGPISLWQPFTDGAEILKYGFISKRKGLFARRRMFLLTTGPRLIYIDPVTMVKKGEIPWSDTLSVEAKNFKTFYVYTRLGSANVNEANTYQVVDTEEEDIVVSSADTLTETFELEIIPYEVYKRDLANTNNVSFYGWSNLTVLSIHDCQLESLHPDFLYGLERLQRLSLQHNNLKVLPSFAFYGAPNLRLLSLARNRLLEVSFYSLAGLLELQVLDLSENSISKVSELTFPPFPKLAKLDLRQNPIEYVFDSSFAIANMTRSLFIGSDVVGLQIGTLKPFQGLSQMELLEIRNLQVPALNQYLFRGLLALRTLRLLQGNISFVEYDSFAEMKNLSELQASHCSIGVVSMDAFFGVKRLRTIDLSYNLLTELPVGLFDEQLGLLELYLQGNRLTQLPSDFFRRLAAGVQIVRLTENPWHCSCSMVHWRQAATNRLKVSSTSDNPLAASYVYSNKLTPRCSDSAHGIQNRGVYYVIRKNLQCTNDINNTKEAHKAALRISEMNRQKQQALLLKRYIGNSRRFGPAQLTISTTIIQQPGFRLTRVESRINNISSLSSE